MTERIKKVVKPTAIVMAIGFIYIILHFSTGFSIPCVFHLLTRLYCPGCGMGRLCFSLLKLDFASAFKYNPVIFCILPVFAVFFAWHIYRYIRFGDSSFRKWENVLLYVIVGVLVVFGVLRNFVDLGMPPPLHF
jgi:hypothetical protein